MMEQENNLNGLMKKVLPPSAALAEKRAILELERELNGGECL